MKVLNYNECAQQSGIVRRTFERLIASGEGPPIVEISPRRRGVIETDFEAWLLKRRRPAPGWPEESASSINALPNDESSDSPRNQESQSGTTRRQSSQNSARADFSSK